MNDKDSKLLSENYQKVQEGILDRAMAAGQTSVGARAKQAGGGIAKLAGKGLSKLGYQRGDDWQQAGQATMDAGGAQADQEKLAHHAVAAGSSIDGAVEDLVTDLSKSGLDVADAEALKVEIKALIDKFVGGAVSGRGWKRDMPSA